MTPQRFVWTKTADEVTTKAKQCHAQLDHATKPATGH